VRDIMKADPLTVSSSTPTLEALDIMQANRVGCLPVVDGGQLVGILTSYDFLAGAARLFREHLAESSPSETKAKVVAQHA
jgi:acetoin utilization protein AcuB